MRLRQRDIGCRINSLFSGCLFLLHTRTPCCRLKCRSVTCSTYTRFFFFLSLLHKRADDEVLTRLLHISLFLFASPILAKSMFFSFRSSLTLSIQIFFPCLPLLLFPSTCPCKVMIGSLSPSVYTDDMLLICRSVTCSKYTCMCMMVSMDLSQ